MNQERILAAIGYFGILFVPVLFPLIIFLATIDQKVRKHAKTAMISQIFPFVFWIIGVVVIFISGFGTLITRDTGESFGITFLTIIGLGILIDISLYIYNLIKGTLVLFKEDW